MITTVADFVNAVNALDNVTDAYDIFEFDCTETVQDDIYALAATNCNEPFRNAMHALGFVTY